MKSLYEYILREMYMQNKFIYLYNKHSPISLVFLNKNLPFI